MKEALVAQLAELSTCRKRRIVCVLTDGHGGLVAAASNQCTPPEGGCARIGVRNAQGDYPSTSACHWEHAEQRALTALKPGARPVVAVVYGHDFVCPDCERALRAAGVTTIAVVPAGFGTGLCEEGA